MKRKLRLQLIIGLVLALIITSGLYAFSYLTATATMGVTVTGDEIATYELSAAQPDWDSILTPVAAGTETLRPNAAGTYSQADPVGEVSNYLAVDEEVTDDDSTYVETSGDATEIDTYNIPDHSEGYGTISSVTVYVRYRGTTTADLHAAETVIRTHDTDYFGDYTLLPLAYIDSSTTYTTNPYTGSAWTWDEIDALEIGVRMYDLGDGDLRTTQVYAEVDYAAPLLSGSVPTGNLFDITPDGNFSGDLAVKVYLTNTGDLVKAYDYLNMNLYLEGSVEAGETPNYQLLTLDNGEATFNLQGYAPGTYTLSVTGGSYGLVSTDTSQWEAGWTVTPEFYSLIMQR